MALHQETRMSAKTSRSFSGKHLGKIQIMPLIGLYLLFIIAATWITYYLSSIAQKDLIDSVYLQLRKEFLVNEQLHAIHSRHLLIRDILMEEDPFIKDDYMALNAEFARRVLTSRLALEELPLSEEEKTLIDNQWNDSQTGYNLQGSYIEKSMEADHDTRMDLYADFVSRTQSTFLKCMNEMSSYRNQLRLSTEKSLRAAEQNKLRS
jgi:hypothetical protein